VLLFSPKFIIFISSVIMQERHQVVRLQIPREISNDVDRFFALCEANNHCVVQKQVMYQGC